MRKLLITAALAAAMAPAAEAQQVTARATIINAQGQNIGTATFTQAAHGVLIQLEVTGLPTGWKGVHLHAVGTCEGPQFTSAGGHFNPGSHQHGIASNTGHHAGDLPNLYVHADGVGRAQFFTNDVSLRPGANSLFDADNSAIVIHANPDDHVTDPIGNAGGRIACGVIQRG